MNDGRTTSRYTGRARPPKSAIQPTGKPSAFMITAPTQWAMSSLRPAVAATPAAQSGRLFRICGGRSGAVEGIGPLVVKFSSVPCGEPSCSGAFAY